MCMHRSAYGDPDGNSSGEGPPVEGYEEEGDVRVPEDRERGD